jgi:glutamyl-Q tRNA(Asp) synthetase
MHLTCISRFAPSPTGLLHLGHAWSAMLAHDLARARGGQFILRIEDTDVTRCRPEFTQAILVDLAWLGLSWDALMVQSTRFAHYDTALATLQAMEMVYPCFCTRSDIAREVAASLHAPHGADGPLYPGTCRQMELGERAARLRNEPHSWRLDAGRALERTGPLHWHYAKGGAVKVDITALGDFVLKGRDRPASYHLAVVVDDGAHGVTDVVRGQDIFPSTHAHRLLQALLGLQVPNYYHHPLIVDSSGIRLAKRRHAPTLTALREDGVDGPGLLTEMREGLFPIGFGLAGV